jgi:hypothetical protein
MTETVRFGKFAVKERCAYRLIFAVSAMLQQCARAARANAHLRRPEPAQFHHQDHQVRACCQRSQLDDGNELKFLLIPTSDMFLFFFGVDSARPAAHFN